MRTVLITGAKDFIGKNLAEELRHREGIAVQEFDFGDAPERLNAGLRNADIIFHLASIYRPLHPDEYETGNVGLTCTLIDELERQGRHPLIIFESSIQAELDNPYGQSKLKAERILRDYAERHGAAVRIFRLAHVFGKWCRPNYNSVVATFCYNSTHHRALAIADAAAQLQLMYIDDVVKAWLAILEETAPAAGCRLLSVEPVYTTTVGRLAELMKVFSDVRTRLILPDLSDRFIRCLYATYLSYYDPGDLGYALDQKADQRGRLAELLKSESFGQIFVSRTRPGIVRGHHYHRTKIEKFIIIAGEACIRLQHINTGQTVAYNISGGDFKVVDIPPGYAHSIQNIGTAELIVLFWAGELFDSSAPDTYPYKVGIS